MRRAVIDIAEYARWFDMGWSREGDTLRATVAFAAVAAGLELEKLELWKGEVAVEKLRSTGLDSGETVHRRRVTSA